MEALRKWQGSLEGPCDRSTWIRLLTNLLCSNDGVSFYDPVIDVPNVDQKGQFVGKIAWIDDFLYHCPCLMPNYEPARDKIPVIGLSPALSYRSEYDALTSIYDQRSLDYVRNLIMPGEVVFLLHRAGECGAFVPAFNDGRLTLVPAGKAREHGELKSSMRYRGEWLWWIDERSFDVISTSWIMHRLVTNVIRHYPDRQMEFSALKLPADKVKFVVID